MLIAFLLMVCIFYSTDPGMRELVVFAIFSALLIISIFLTSRYYLTDKKSLKKRLIDICISFILITIFYMVIKKLAGFSVDYSFIILFHVVLLVTTLWELLDLTLLEKGILVLTLVTIIAVKIFDVTMTTPSNAVQLYRSELMDQTRYEDIQDILLDDFRDNFSREDFRNIEPYLDQHPLRSTQPALLEFEGGKILLVEVGYQDPDKPLRVSNISLLPEEIASYFRYYPLEIKRDADFPAGREDDETIIEARGAFISRATLQQERDWYDQLIGVFGKKEVWDELSAELGGLYAPEGSVVAAGTKSEGYLEFSFDKDWEIEKKVLDEIYELFRERAADHGIMDLPVIFRFR